MLKKPGYFSSFMRLSKKCPSRDGGDVSTGADVTAGGGDVGGGATRNASGSSRWRLKNISLGLRWKRKSLLGFHLWLVDGFFFKIISFFEAVALVSALACFYLCCGCHI